MSLRRQLACAGIALAVAGAPAVAHAQSLNFGSLGSTGPAQPAPPTAAPSWQDQPIPFRASGSKKWRGEGWSTSCYIRVSIDLSYWNADTRWFSMYPDLPYGELYAVNDNTGEAKYLSLTGGDGRFSGGIIASYGLLDRFPAGETSIVRMEIRTMDGEVTVLGTAPVTIPAECPVSDEEALAKFGPNQVGELARQITPDGLTLTRS